MSLPKYFYALIFAVFIFSLASIPAGAQTTNTNTLKNQFLKSIKEDQFVLSNKQNQVISLSTPTASNQPVKFNYNKHYQLKSNKKCLNNDLNLIRCNKNTPNTRFSINDKGHVITNQNLPTGLMISIHPYPQSNCEEGKILVEGNCVCNPNETHPKCSNTDGTLCQHKLRRLNDNCVRFSLLNRINRLFWKYFQQGFWTDYPFISR